ncbi:hypothetical protein BHM03_00011020 [Ensete ventricosum]|nr:hypothetical protein BHM03_00011020 [Ensete ventricosum]
MARPPAMGRLAVAKAPLQRGGRLRPGPCKGRSPARAAAHKGWPPVGAAAARGHDRLRPARKGLPPVAWPQGVAARNTPARGSRLRPTHKGLRPRRACKGATARG